MGIRRLSILWLLIGAGFVADACGRSAMERRGGRQSMPFRTPPQSSVVEFDMKYDISSPGKTQVVSLVVLIPKTIPGRQTILSREYSPKPSRVFRENGNHYAEFIIREPEEHEKIEISVKAELLRYDLLTARTGSDEEPDGDSRPEDFLSHERYIESDDDEIRLIAESIAGENEFDVVRGVYNYVIDHMDYVVRGDEDRGALKALELGKGDCTEYSDLFVALCRAKNIPARVVTGYTVRTNVATSKHNWVEVYMKDRGWVPIDPAAGDAANGMYRYRSFGRMSPAYIYLSHVRNDRVLRNHNFGAFSYWGDKVTLTDSIEFRFPDQSTADSR